VLRAAVAHLPADQQQQVMQVAAARLRAIEGGVA
jgi:hypothetical protein